MAITRPTFGQRWRSCQRKMQFWSAPFDQMLLSPARRKKVMPTVSFGFR
jgi:hypothetical protein